MRHVILTVAGFHRSGTSMVARMFHQAGLFLGDDLLPGSESNQRGHFEDREVLALHDGLLRRQGVDWRTDRLPDQVANPTERRNLLAFIDRRNRKHQQWGFKDPRVCLFLQVWQSLVPDLSVVVVFRHWRECLNSFLIRHSRNYLSCFGPKDYNLSFFADATLALRMWLTANRELVRLIRHAPGRCLVIGQDEVLAGAPLLQIAKERFSLDLDLATPDGAAAEQELISDILVDLAVPDAIRTDLDRVWADLERLRSAEFSPWSRPKRAWAPPEPPVGTFHLLARELSARWAEAVSDGR